MTYELIIDERANQDLRRAYLWQEERKKGLGGELGEEIEKVFNHLVYAPMHHQIRYADKRIAYTDRFGYGVHYRVRGHLVEVVGLHHQKQNPDKWTKRD